MASIPLRDTPNSEREGPESGRATPYAKTVALILPVLMVGTLVIGLFAYEQYLRTVTFDRNEKLVRLGERVQREVSEAEISAIRDTIRNNMAPKTARSWSLIAAMFIACWDLFPSAVSARVEAEEQESNGK